MNPASSILEESTLPSLAAVRKQLKIRWYRCPIDRDTLRALSTPDDRRGLAHALGHLFLWLVTGTCSFYSYVSGNWWLFVPALLAHGIVASFFTAPHHELCHKTVFRNKTLNDVFLRIFSMLGWLNFRIYQFSHNYHHRYTLHLEGDREEVLPVTPSLRALYLLQLFTFNVTGGYQSRGLIPTIRNFVDIAANNFSNPFNSWGTELYEGFDEERAKAARWARLVLAFHAGVVIVALLIGQPILILLISGSVFIANFHRYFVGVPMHCGLRTSTSDFRKCVRTITLDPISEFLYWHMNWHLEHHMYAGVPCYNLKALHKAVAHDMPQPRSLVGAWKEMRATWKRQLREPDYAYDTPVPQLSSPPRKHNEADPLAASVGGLAPKGLELTD